MTRGAGSFLGVCKPGNASEVMPRPGQPWTSGAGSQGISRSPTVLGWKCMLRGSSVGSSGTEPHLSKALIRSVAHLRAGFPPSQALHFCFWRSIIFQNKLPAHRRLSQALLLGGIQTKTMSTPPSFINIFLTFKDQFTCPRWLIHHCLPVRVTYSLACASAERGDAVTAVVTSVWPYGSLADCLPSRNSVLEDRDSLFI